MTKAIISKAELRTIPQYREYEQVLEWFHSNDMSEDLPDQYKRWLKLWRFADNLVCQGHLGLEVIAKMMVKEFPDEKLTLKTAWKHVTNALNYYNSSQNLSKDTHRRVASRHIDDMIAVMWEALSNNPANIGKIILAALKEKAEILDLKNHDEKEDPSQGTGETYIVFDSDHQKHGFPNISDKQLETMFEEWVDADIVDEEEANQLRKEAGLKPKQIGIESSEK